MLKNRIFQKKLCVLVIIVMIFIVDFNTFAPSHSVLAKTELSSPTTLAGAGLRQAAIDKLKNRVPDYSLSDVLSLDLTAPSGVSVQDLKRVSKKGLVGLEEEFWQAEQKYGVNCVFLMSIAALESGWGTSLFRTNNMFGFGSKGFSSKAECIDTVARSLKNNYLSEDGPFYYGTSIKHVNRRYAANPQWYLKVGKIMAELYGDIYDNHQETVKNLN